MGDFCCISKLHNCPKMFFMEVNPTKIVFWVQGINKTLKLVANAGL